VESALAADIDALPGRTAALALAFTATLLLLACDERVQAPLPELETSFAELDEDDRQRLGVVLARAATPALGLDLELMKSEGYYYVSVFPPEGSEGVDIVGKAAKWLTRRMTMDGDAPRAAMRRFLAILAHEVEGELPAVAGTLERLLAEPPPPAPASDPLFVALARGLVEEAVAERGFPF
jgi:signal transduction histidine kinase